MPKLEWGTAGERYFEAGVDRGVLYINGLAGIPWNGLVAVKESPSGGEPRPYYLDGVKYLNLATAEEFEATIEAYSAPFEFGRCEGIEEISNGLFMSEQRRESFGFCYRTRVGNDVDGPDHGYKLHIVYNALAGPTDRENNSLGDSTEPMTLSWPITTLPPIVATKRPTAHYVIDTRKAPGGLVRHLERILYGGESTNATLIPAADLIDLFVGEPPVLFANMVKNPQTPRAIASTVAGVSIANTTGAGGLVQLAPGYTYTVLGTLTAAAAQASANDIARSIYWSTDSSIIAKPPQTLGTYELRGTFTVPSSGGGELKLGGDTNAVSWSQLAVIEGVYNGPYFDGDTPDVTTGKVQIYKWTGASNNSLSTLNAWGD